VKYLMPFASCHSRHLFTRQIDPSITPRINVITRSS
jgi:hypothetical protein